MHERAISTPLPPQTLRYIERVLESKEGLNRTDNSTFGPLHLVAGAGRIDLVSRLIEARADINDKDILGRTPLYHAVACDRIFVIDQLLESNANVHIEDKFHWTPLMKANVDGHHHLASMLILRGAAM